MTLGLLRFTWAICGYVFVRICQRITRHLDKKNHIHGSKFAGWLMFKTPCHKCLMALIRRVLRRKMAPSTVTGMRIYSRNLSEFNLLPTICRVWCGRRASQSCTGRNKNSPDHVQQFDAINYVAFAFFCFLFLITYLCLRIADGESSHRSLVATWPSQGRERAALMVYRMRSPGVAVAVVKVTTSCYMGSARWLHLVHERQAAVVSIRLSSVLSW